MLKVEHIEVDDDDSSEVDIDKPTSVYIAYSATDEVLYVGITSRNVLRFAEHQANQVWWHLAVQVKVEHHPTRQAALDRENLLIRRLAPRFNIAGTSAKVANPAPRSIHLDLDAWDAAQRRGRDDGAGSMSSWVRIWVDVRANAPKGLLRWLIRQAEDEERPAWEIVVRALQRERAACQTPAVEPEPGDDDAPAGDDGGSNS